MLVSPMRPFSAWTGPEAADGWGREGEQEVLGDEPPREQADDGADLVANDHAEADAEGAPECDRGQRAEQEQCRLAARLSA